MGEKIWIAKLLEKKHSKAFIFIALKNRRIGVGTRNVVNQCGLSEATTLTTAGETTGR